MDKEYEERIQDLAIEIERKLEDYIRLNERTGHCFSRSETAEKNIKNAEAALRKIKGYDDHDFA